MEFLKLLPSHPLLTNTLFSVIPIPKMAPPVICFLKPNT